MHESTVNASLIGPCVQVDGSESAYLSAEQGPMPVRLIAFPILELPLSGDRKSLMLGDVHAIQGRP